MEKEKDNRTSKVHIRLTEAELQKIKELTHKYGNDNLSWFIRRCIFEKTFIVYCVNERNNGIISSEKGRLPL
jgi:hypothetical protein